MIRSCSIGFYEVFVSTHFSIKSIIYFDDSTSGAMSVMSAIGGGGVEGIYHSLCIVDCVLMLTITVRSRNAIIVQII